MNYRTLGKTGLNVSELSLGTWQVGGKWGSGFDEKNAERILNEAIDQGINFIDTADVYENRQSRSGRRTRHSFTIRRGLYRDQMREVHQPPYE